MTKPVKPMADEGRWKCEACGQEFGYTQPIPFSLQLDLLKVFSDYHGQHCQGFTKDSPSRTPPSNPYAMPENAAACRKHAHHIGYGTSKRKSSEPSGQEGEVSRG
ncbi:MAG: hypothetical protein ACRYFX_18705 [Janthinobacterium lividum]